MTLCISASCFEKNGSPRIVLCSDTRIEDEVAGANIEDKVDRLIPRWVTLISAEDMAGAEELLDFYAEDFRKKQPNRRTALADLKKPALRKKIDIFDEATKKLVGMTYEKLLASGRASLGEQYFNNVLMSVNSESLGCELIISGFIDSHPYMFKVSKDGSVKFTRHFAIVGSGFYIANAILYQRKQKESLSLYKTLYHLYEAKRLARGRAPAVGKETHIDIIRPNKKEGYRILSVSKDGMDFLKELFSLYGPKQIPEKIKMEKRHFMDF